MSAWYLAHRRQSWLSRAVRIWATGSCGWESHEDTDRFMTGAADIMERFSDGRAECHLLGSTEGHGWLMPAGHAATGCIGAPLGAIQT